MLAPPLPPNYPAGNWVCWGQRWFLCVCECWCMDEYLMQIVVCSPWWSPARELCVTCGLQDVSALSLLSAWYLNIYWRLNHDTTSRSADDDRPRAIRYGLFPNTRREQASGSKGERGWLVYGTFIVVKIPPHESSARSHKCYHFASRSFKVMRPSLSCALEASLLSLFLLNASANQRYLLTTAPSILTGSIKRWDLFSRCLH